MGVITRSAYALEGRETLRKETATLAAGVAARYVEHKAEGKEVRVRISGPSDAAAALVQQLRTSGVKCDSAESSSSSRMTKLRVDMEVQSDAAAWVVDVTWKLQVAIVAVVAGSGGGSGGGAIPTRPPTQRATQRATSLVKAACLAMVRTTKTGRNWADSSEHNGVWRRPFGSKLAIRRAEHDSVLKHNTQLVDGAAVAIVEESSVSADIAAVSWKSFLDGFYVAAGFTDPKPTVTKMGASRFAVRLSDASALVPPIDTTPMSADVGPLSVALYTVELKPLDGASILLDVTSTEVKTVPASGTAYATCVIDTVMPNGCTVDELKGKLRAAFPAQITKLLALLESKMPTPVPYWDPIARMTDEHLERRKTSVVDGPIRDNALKSVAEAMQLVVERVTVAMVAAGTELSIDSIETWPQEKPADLASLPSNHDAVVVWDAAEKISALVSKNAQLLRFTWIFQELHELGKVIDIGTRVLCWIRGESEAGLQATAVDTMTRSLANVEDMCVGIDPIGDSGIGAALLSLRAIPTGLRVSPITFCFKMGIAFGRVNSMYAPFIVAAATINPGLPSTRYTDSAVHPHDCLATLLTEWKAYYPSGVFDDAAAAAAAQKFAAETDNWPQRANDAVDAWWLTTLLPAVNAAAAYDAAAAAALELPIDNERFLWLREAYNGKISGVEAAIASLKSAISACSDIPQELAYVQLQLDISFNSPFAFTMMTRISALVDAVPYMYKISRHLASIETMTPAPTADAVYHLTQAAPVLDNSVIFSNKAFEVMSWWAT
jgi:hypothetical protein